MTANSMQVGGNHYKTSYEHWDLMLDNNMGVDYLVGCATKYVSRWRKKNGIEDLKKALHYVNKLIENKGITNFNGNINVDMTIDRFAQANELGPEETAFCRCLLTMEGYADFYEARKILLGIMEQYDREQDAAAVPLEDSNKHADRAEESSTQGGA